MEVTLVDWVATANYDAQARLTRYANTAYSYSKNGELTKRAFPLDTTSYTYEELGNLITVVKQGGTRIDYLIDGENRRVGKKLNGVLQKLWLYEDGLRPVAELDTSGNVVSRFVYGSRSNVPDYMVKGGTTYWLITDQLGSVRLVVNASSGAVAQRIDYDAWGRDTLDTSPGFQAFAFAGGLYDPATKLVRFGARDYDASVGRWTCKDPDPDLIGDPNIFVYCFNDATNWIDRAGATPEGAAAGAVLGGAVGAALGGAVGAAIGAAGGGAAGVAGGTLVAPGVGTVAGGAAGTTAGAIAGAVNGSAIGAAYGALVGGIAGDVISNTMARSRDRDQVDRGDRKEHRKGKRPSTREKHEKGRGRARKDCPGGEKKDADMPHRRK